MNVSDDPVALAKESYARRVEHWPKNRPHDPAAAKRAQDKRRAKAKAARKARKANR